MGKSCPKGQWCCLDESAKKSVCVPCRLKVFGHCLEDDKTVCAKAGYKSWNSLADVEDAVITAGESATKAAIEAWLRSHGYKAD